MSARIEVQVTGHDVLVTVRGVIDRETSALASGLCDPPAECRTVVVDLREAVLASREGVHELVTSLREQLGSDRIALVCDRLPGRRLLRLACGAGGVRVLDAIPPAEGRPAQPRRRRATAAEPHPQPARPVAEAV